MPADLQPPDEFKHLRWHWINMMTWEEPRPVEWCSGGGGFWRYLGFATLPEKAANAYGWTYWKPCDSAAITLPTDAEERAAQIIYEHSFAANAGGDSWDRAKTRATLDAHGFTAGVVARCYVAGRDILTMVRER